jgi:hypothetical protein
LKVRLTVEHGIVRQIVDEVKTENSDTAMTIAPELLAVLKAWKQATQFAGADDWIFASPVQLGRLPFSYTGVLHVFQKAAAGAGIGVIGTIQCATRTVLGWTLWARQSRSSRR